MMEIALCVDLDAERQERLRRSIAPARLIDRRDSNLPSDCLSECEIVFGNPPVEWLPAAQKLRWMQLESVGFGEYAHLDWNRPGQCILVTNLAGFFEEPVAETVLAGLLALIRGIDRLVRLQVRVEWEGDRIRPTLGLLARARVVLVGYGAINRRLAEYLMPFRCSITVLRSDSSTEELDAALPKADVIVCTAPDTPATRNLFNAERLARLPAHAVFANFGRGSILDEAALADALSAGRLAGAVLDVTREEPLPADNRLWSCPNILITQHSGGGTSDELDRKIDHFLDNLERYRRGDALVGIVDFNRGY